MTARNIVVAQAGGQFIEDIAVEIVERKGIGHPDSLCDGIAERVSVEYSRWCQDNLGTLLHHNFDKVQLVAGEVEVGYGGGYLLKPIRLQLAGRGTPAFKGQKVNFRPWNGQLRQPIVLVDQAMPVSVSPQPGFLHKFAEVDTLGIDQPECRCKFK